MMDDSSNSILDGNEEDGWAEADFKELKEKF
jgi:hypothetical protein